MFYISGGKFELANLLSAWQGLGEDCAVIKGTGGVRTHFSSLKLLWHFHLARRLS